MSLFLLLFCLQDDPDAELRSFQLAEGYEVNLFASEKDGVVKPIQMRWDPRGRLWVTCSPSYPQIAPGDRPDDMIVVLEDRDRDGRADTSQVFARRLTMPMGLELGRGGAFVADGTELVHLKDTDGDGQADARRVLLRGFFTGDSHQSINNFVWGPGGELVFCQGLHAFGHVETPWGVESLLKAGVWRLRERRLRLDPFLGDDMGPQNPWGFAFDDWGQPIVVAGNGQGVYYMLPVMIRTRHFRPYAQIWDRAGPKFSGPDVLGTRHLADDVQGRLVTGSFMNNSVYWFRLEDDGSGFRAKDLPPLLISRHTSFRPVDVKVGPDGAIYVLDWYNPIIGHYQASLRHPSRDKTRGRVWRITAKGRSFVQPPDLPSLALPELFDQFRCPERWVRHHVARVLADRDTADVTRALSAWVEALDPKDPQHESLLYQALGTFETHESVEPALLKKLLAARDPRARAYATAVIAHWHDRLEKPLELLADRAVDEHPRVRLAAVVAASYVPDPKAVEVAASALARPADRFITHALTLAVHALKPHWKPAFDEGRLSFENNLERLQFILKADGTRDVLDPLLKLARSETLSAEARANVRVLLAGVGGPDELALALASPSPRVLAELASAYRLRKVKPSGDLVEPLRALLPAEGAVRLVGLWKVEPLVLRVRALAREGRPAAFEALADLGDHRTLKELARDPRAVVALTRVKLDLAAEAAAPLFAEGGDPTPLVEAFLSRQGGAEALARALGKVLPDTAKLALRAMSTAGRQDAALRDALSKAAGLGSAGPEYGAEFVRELADDAARKGDGSRGERVFRGALTNCVSCHAIGGAGGRAGPDLATAGTGLPVDLLIESLLWPNRQVKEGYTTTRVVTADGEIVQGYRVNEDKDRLTLREPQTDEHLVVAKVDIRARKEAGSLMPDGLTNGLTRQELVDLVRFLSELGRPGPFRVPDRPLVRKWSVLLRAPEGGGLPAGPWVPRPATVSGELPAEEAPGGWGRFEVEVAKRGRIRLDAGSGQVWFDGRKVAARLEIDLEPGIHSFTIRSTSPLQCKISTQER